MEKTAVVSACGQYRYLLTRRWGDGPAVLYVMLNPSTADASIDDPTIVRCMERARRLGHSAIEVVNLFALRSTQPKALYKHPDPVGPENALHLVRAVLRGGRRHLRLGRSRRKGRAWAGGRRHQDDPRGWPYAIRSRLHQRRSAEAPALCRPGCETRGH